MLTFIEYLTEARGQSPFREKAKELYGYLKAIKGAKPISYEDKVKFTTVGEQRAEFGIKQYIKLDKSKTSIEIDAPIDAEFTKTAKTVATLLGIKGNVKPKVTTKHGNHFYTAFIRTIEYKGTIEDGYKIEYTATMTSDENKLEHNISHEVVLIGKKSTVKTSGFTDFPNIVPGTIFSASWGYDMTIVEYWQVVKRTGKSVYVREISGTKSGGLSGTVTANKDSFVDTKTYRCVLSGDPKDKTNKSVSITVDGRYATVWNGKANYYNSLD